MPARRQRRRVCLLSTGLALGGVVAIGLGPERVRRVWVAILTLGLLAVAATTLLTPYDAFDGGKGIVTAVALNVPAVRFMVPELTEPMFSDPAYILPPLRL